MGLDFSAKRSRPEQVAALKCGQQTGWNPELQRRRALHLWSADNEPRQRGESLGASEPENIPDFRDWGRERSLQWSVHSGIPQNKVLWGGTWDTSNEAGTSTWTYLGYSAVMQVHLHGHTWDTEQRGSALGPGAYKLTLFLFRQMKDGAIKAPGVSSAESH